ncbi:MAG: tyrosine-type recombinase/integrase [Clostridia bacterium]|nr:tyrosine-type recombinase/integrase [Clostridia bacterium]
MVQCNRLSQSLCAYEAFLREEEYAENTISKYLRDVRALLQSLEDRPLTRAELVAYKASLCRRYAPASVNSMLAAVNSYLRFLGRGELRLRFVRVQKTLFRETERELERPEYVRLVKTAERRGQRRLALVMQVLCSTGLRVSELSFVTVEAVRRGRAEVFSKGKRRVVFLPKKLQKSLFRYLADEKRTTGPVFVTKTGKPMDRFGIWRAMKGLCREAGVSPQKVFPHNLRHLFARVFYGLDHDLSRLGDILGHSSLNTTRIYTAESGEQHARLMERTGLFIT